MMILTTEFLVEGWCNSVLDADTPRGHNEDMLISCRQNRVTTKNRSGDSRGGRSQTVFSKQARSLQVKTTSHLVTNE